MNPSTQKLSFTRASDGNVEKLSSFILEAYIDDKQIADVLCIDDKWYVTLKNGDDTLVRVTLDNWIELTARFAKFVNQENELILRERRQTPHDHEDGLSP